MGFSVTIKHRVSEGVAPTNPKPRAIAWHPLATQDAAHNITPRVPPLCVPPRPPSNPPQPIRLPPSLANTTTAADIDPEPTAAQRAAAEALIAAERATVPDDPQHALLRPAYEPRFSALMAPELARTAASPRRPLTAVDVARYEVEDVAAGADAAAVAAALRRAYASATYLSGRRQHLALLDSYGKNAWLVGNAALEAEVAALERELAAARRDVDLTTVARQRAQEAVAGELRGLDEAWRKGVGRVLETEVAAEGMRRRVDEARRERR